MRAVILLLTGLAFTLALPSDLTQRVSGGAVTTIDQYPQAAVVLATDDFSLYRHNCGSTILNNVAILTAAHCHSRGLNPATYRVRVGSSFASSGGVVHLVQQVINHPNYSELTIQHDIAILRLASFITFSNVVQAGAISGPNYNAGDNQPVWAIGWGVTEFGFPSEQLRRIQLFTFSQELCRQRYGNWVITDDMLCAGLLDQGEGGVCTGDSGGPLLHNNVVVGALSFGAGACGDARIPSVYARVSNYVDWIVANAQ